MSDILVKDAAPTNKSFAVKAAMLASCRAVRRTSQMCRSHEYRRLARMTTTFIAIVWMRRRMMVRSHSYGGRGRSEEREELTKS